MDPKIISQRGDLPIKSHTQITFSTMPIPDASVFSAVATAEQKELRRDHMVKVPASPQLSLAAASPRPDLSLMLTPEGNTVDFFDQMSVPMPAYATSRRLDFSQSS